MEAPPAASNDPFGDAGVAATSQTAGVCIQSFCLFQSADFTESIYKCIKITEIY